MATNPILSQVEVEGVTYDIRDNRFQVPSASTDMTQEVGVDVNGALKTRPSNVENLFVFGHTNFLDNWYFISPINQRGIVGSISNTSGADGVFILDRWKLSQGTADVECQNGKYNITLSGTMTQKIFESFDFLAGSLIGSVLVSLVDSDDLVLFTSDQSDPSDRVHVSWDSETRLFSITAQGGYRIVACKLECNTTQSLATTYGGELKLADRPDSREQLYRCMRYFQSSYPPGYAPGNKYIATGNTASLYGSDTIRAYNKTYLYSGIQFFLPMRQTPTLTFYSATTGAAGYIRDLSAGKDIKAQPYRASAVGSAVQMVDNDGVAGNQMGFLWVADTGE